MFFKKQEPKCCNPCWHIAAGMIIAFGIVALTAPGKKFIKSKMQCLGKKLEGCDALMS